MRTNNPKNSNGKYVSIINFFSSDLGLQAPIASNADVYNALCEESNSSSNTDSSTTQVANCQITLYEEGFTGPIDFIPKDNISQWYSVRQDDSLLLGVAGTASGTYAGAFAGMAACAVRAGILCIPALFGGVYGGGLLGSQAGKGKNSLFSVIGQNYEGKPLLKVLDSLIEKLQKIFKKNYLIFLKIKKKKKKTKKKKKKNK